MRWMQWAGILSFAMLVAAAHAGRAVADDAKLVPSSKQQIEFSYAPVVKKVAPAVVNIYTKSRVQVIQNASPFMNDPFFNQFFGGMPGFTFGGKPREQVVNSLGSGVLVNNEGLIVTSHHVIKDAEAITVVLQNKQEFEAKVMLKDPKTDLAFLQIKAPNALPFLELRDSDTIEVGDLVLAIGNPFGVGQTVTSGIISGLARKAEGVSDYQFFIQTDAAINPGNSGGALVDMDGKLVGINTAIYSKSGGSVGIGFAIPANMVKALAQAQVQGGKAVHAWLGVTGQPVTAEMAESVGMKTSQGVMVTKIASGSPLEKSGLKTGDIIVSINDAPLGNERDLQYRLVLSKIGDSVTLGVWRAGKIEAIHTVLIAPPEVPKRDERVLAGKQPLSGLKVINLSPALAVELGIDDTLSGVMIVGVGPSELGVNIGLVPGDMILELNDVKIISTEQLQSLVKKSSTQWKLVFRRGNAVQTLNITM